MSAEISDADKELETSIIEIQTSDRVRIYDRSGKYIFTGSPKQLCIFLRNKDFGSVENIAGIEGNDGKSIIRFGPEDGYGFISRAKIGEIIQRIVQLIVGQEKISPTSQIVGKVKENLLQAAAYKEDVLKKEIKDIYKRVYFQCKLSLSEDLFLSGKGINPNTGKRFFEPVSGEIGQHFDGHGIAKVDQLTKLLVLLEKGIDKKREFYTAPFALPGESIAGMGPAMGTSGGTCCKHGIAVLTSGYKQNLVDNGIKHVFINDVYSDLKEPLSRLFPQYQFHLLSEQKQVLEVEVKENNP